MTHLRNDRPAACECASGREAGTIALMSMRERDRGFAPDEQALFDRRVAARSLIGQRIVQVAYVVSITEDGTSVIATSRPGARSLTQLSGATPHGMQACSTPWISALS